VFRRSLFNLTARGLKEFYLPSLFSRMSDVFRGAVITLLAKSVIHNISGIEIFIYLFIYGLFNDTVSSSAFLSQMLG
jgi:hypothetical protein